MTDLKALRDRVAERVRYAEARKAMRWPLALPASEAENPARALLLAILDAMIGEKE